MRSLSLVRHSAALIGVVCLALAPAAHAQFTSLDAPLAASGTKYGTYGWGISGSDIVGYYLDGSRTAHGFLYDGSAYTTLDDPLGMYGSTAYGISGGSIVGVYFDDTGAHSYLYDRSAYPALNDPLANGDTEAFGVSGKNIVGYYTDDLGFIHGFLYDGSAYTTLDDPLGTQANYALGIDGSNIVGAYTDTTTTHGFLYDSTVPEPGSAALLIGLGVTGAGWAARRRRTQANHPLR